MCRELKKLGLKKKTYSVVKRWQQSAKIKRIILGKSEKSSSIKPNSSGWNGVWLGLSINYAISPHDTRVSDLKPFDRGERITALGAISIKKGVALITMNDSMDAKAFEVFIEKILVPELARGIGSSNG